VAKSPSFLGIPQEAKITLFLPSPRRPKLPYFYPTPTQVPQVPPRPGGILNNILLAHFSDFPKLPQGGGCRKKGVPGTFFLTSPVGVFRDAFSTFTKKPFFSGKTQGKVQKTRKVAPKKTDFFAQTPRSAPQTPGQPHGPPGQPHGPPGQPHGPPGQPHGPPGQPHGPPPRSATSVRTFSLFILRLNKKQLLSFLH